MKKQILVLLLLAAGFMASAGDGENANQLVQQKFQANFGKTTQVKWLKIRDIYVGYFIQDNQLMDSYFTENGELLATGKYFVVNDVDKKTVAAINKRFAGWSIEQAYELTPVNEEPQKMFVITNDKFSAVIKFNKYSPIEVVQMKKIDASKNVDATIAMISNRN